MLFYIAIPTPLHTRLIPVSIFRLPRTFTLKLEAA